MTNSFIFSSWRYINYTRIFQNKKVISQFTLWVLNLRDFYKCSFHFHQLVLSSRNKFTNDIFLFWYEYTIQTLAVMNKKNYQSCVIVHINLINNLWLCLLCNTQQIIMLILLSNAISVLHITHSCIHVKYKSKDEEKNNMKTLDV